MASADTCARFENLPSWATKMRATSVLSILADSFLFDLAKQNIKSKKGGRNCGEHQVNSKSARSPNRSRRQKCSLIEMSLIESAKAIRDAVH